MHIEELIGTEIYSWTTKKWSSKPGLLNMIGTMETPVGMSLENAYRIWNTKAFVEGVELFMDLGKIYVSFVSYSFTVHHHNLMMKFGVWIKVPDDKKKYLKNLEIRNSLKHEKHSDYKLKRKANPSVSQFDKKRRIVSNSGPGNAINTVHGHHSIYDNDDSDERDTIHHKVELEKAEREYHGHHKTGSEREGEGERERERESESEDEGSHKESEHVKTSKYTGELNLLKPRSLLELLELTESDSYIQLGDLYFEENGAIGSKHTNTGGCLRSTNYPGNRNNYDF
jgi:hypothetical protein